MSYIERFKHNGHDFGMQALINGVQFALDNGEDVPRRILIIVGNEIE